MSTGVTKSAAPVLQVLEALCGYAEQGATNKDLADLCKTSPVAITRATSTLMAHGWCRKSDETGRFYPTPAFTRLTFRVLNSFDQAQQRLEDQRHSMTSRHG